MGHVAISESSVAAHTRFVKIRLGGELWSNVCGWKSGCAALTEQTFEVKESTFKKTVDPTKIFQGKKFGKGRCTKR